MLSISQSTLFVHAPKSLPGRELVNLVSGRILLILLFNHTQTMLYIIPCFFLYF